jgi:hypothetical protein
LLDEFIDRNRAVEEFVELLDAGHDLLLNKGVAVEKELKIEPALKLKLELFDFLRVEICVCEFAFGHFVEFSKSLEEDGETVSIWFGEQVSGFLMSGDFK